MYNQIEKNVFNVEHQKWQIENVQFDRACSWKVVVIASSRPCPNFIKGSSQLNI
jgi:hypothetical protein